MIISLLSKDFKVLAVKGFIKKNLKLKEKSQHIHLCNNLCHIINGFCLNKINYLI